MRFTETVLHSMIEFLTTERLLYKKYIATSTLLSEYNKRECVGRRNQLMRIALYIAQNDYKVVKRRAELRELLKLGRIL